MTIHTATLISAKLTLQLSLNTRRNQAHFRLLSRVNFELDTWFDCVINLFCSFLALFNDKVNGGAKSLHLFHVYIAPIWFAFARFGQIRRWRQLIITLHSSKYAAFSSFSDICVVDFAQYFIWITFEILVVKSILPLRSSLIICSAFLAKLTKPVWRFSIRRLLVTDAFTFISRSAILSFFRVECEPRRKWIRSRSGSIMKLRLVVTKSVKVLYQEYKTHPTWHSFYSSFVETL